MLAAHRLSALDQIFKLVFKESIMFFNQPFITQQNEVCVSPQFNFRLPNSSFLLGNQLHLSSLSFRQPKIAVPPVQSQQYQQQKTGWEIAVEIVCALGLGVIIGGALVLTTAAVVELLRPRRNSIPLTAGERRFIRERDGEICFYCEDYAPDGHVDHRVSRNNGGGNEPKNLTWACVFCNCSKGAMNDTDYLLLIEAYH